MGNGDGLLTVVEMREGLKSAGIKEIPSDLLQILQDVDSDGSGIIDYTEFLAATLDRKTYQTEDACWAAFRVFDKDGDGRISRAELQNVLSHEALAGATEIEKMMDEVDVSGDGYIDFEEFMEMMRKPGTGNAK